MLSRTADHLFWMSRYTERAENTSRLLDVNYHTSLLPQSSHEAQAGWEGLLRISELMPAYTEKYGAEITPVPYPHLTLPTIPLVWLPFGPVA